MNRQRRSRYVLAVYLVVLSLAVVLVPAGLPLQTVEVLRNRKVV